MIGHSIEIISKGVHNTVVKVDGKEISSISSIKLSQKAGDIPVLTLDIFVRDLTVKIDKTRIKKRKIKY